jgi:hypothetical protein
MDDIATSVANLIANYRRLAVGVEMDDAAITTLVSYAFTVLLAVLGGYYLGGRRPTSSSSKQSSSSSSTAPPSSLPTLTVPTTNLGGGGVTPRQAASAATALARQMMMDDSIAMPKLLPRASEGNKTRRVIIVANNLPLKLRYDADADEWSVQWDDARSFLGSLQSLQSDMHVQWVGWAGNIPNDQRDRVSDLLATYNCTPVYLQEDLRLRYYEFCKTILWPVFHYVLPQSQHEFGTKW